MSKRAEKYFREYYSLYQNILRVSPELFTEDAQIRAFTEELYENDFIESPFQCIRESGTFSNTLWSLLGYSTSCTTIDLEQEDDNVDIVHTNKSIRREWNYTIFNGEFVQNDEIHFKTITKSEIEKILKKTLNFIKNTLYGNHFTDLGRCRDLQKEIADLNANGDLGTIKIIYITDHLINTIDLPQFLKIPEYELTIGISYIDILKWGDIKNKSLIGSEVNINLLGEDFAHYNIPYIKNTNTKSLNQYLAFFPGQFIADIYEYYNTSLLENNVRVFLSANRKANKALLSTIRDSPKSFFSFNNGISSTASLVATDDSKITRIEDFQIVNGGQTTASLHYAWKKDKMSLNDVLVPVKITELRKDRNYGSMVANISRAANTQTAIRTSDFFANHPFLTSLDKISQKQYITLNSNNLVYLYFERMSGQYNVSYNNSGRTEKFQKAWKREHPSELVFNKIDVARWLNCKMGFPHIAAASAEKQFQLFIEEKNFRIPHLNNISFKYISGYGILFKRIRQLIGTKNGRNYPSIISDSSVGMATAIYTASMFNKISEGKFNYTKIYTGEISIIESLLSSNRINTDIDFVLIKVINEVWRLISAFGGTSVQEQAKRLECWSYVKENFRLFDKNVEDYFRVHQLDLVEEMKIIEDPNIDKFKSFEELLVYFFENNSFRLNSLLHASNFDQEIKKFKTHINNILKRVAEKDKVLKTDKLHELCVISKSFESKGKFNGKQEIENIDQLKVDFGMPIELVRGKLNDVQYFIEKIENITDIDESIINFAHSILDNFEINGGLTINEIEKLIMFKIEG